MKLIACNRSSAANRTAVRMNNTMADVMQELMQMQLQRTSTVKIGDVVKPVKFFVVNKMQEAK